MKDDLAAESSELLQGVDWSRTRAYAVGFGGIYVNQKGREAKGIVAPGPDAEALKARIAADLATWKDPQDLAPVIRKVYRREEILRGPYMDQAPDLFIGFELGYRASWKTAMGAVPPGLLEDNLKKWSGDHLFDPALVPGVFFTNRKVLRDDAAIADITPTILKAAGFSTTEVEAFDFDGRPLF